MNNDAIEFEESSGNVFADIGLRKEHADELYARAHIGIEVLRILEQRQLKQRDISALLGISQSEVSHLMNGRFNRFSEGKLLGFLKKLDRQVTLLITQPNQQESISLSL
jgi:predicted XRE-type DNA-binding protein